MIDIQTARRIGEARNIIRTLLQISENDVKGGACPDARNLRPLPEPSNSIPHAAVDGGNQVIDFRDLSFYYVKAWAHLYDNGLSVGDAWIGIVVPPHHPDYRVSIYREILEASIISGLSPSNSPSIAREALLVLFDGSLRNAIRWWSPGGLSYKGEELARMSEDLPRAERILWELYNKSGSIDSISYINCTSPEECSEELISKAPERPITSRLVMELAARGLLKNYVHDRGKWITALEVLEKLYAYKRALEDSWANDGLAIFLSKHSVSTALCRGKHSDIYYIRRMHRLEPGYIVWKREGLGEGRGSSSLLVGAYEITRLRSRELVRGGLLFYPRRLGLHEFYTSRLASVEFYVRLSKGGPFMLANLAFDTYKVEPEWDNAMKLLETSLKRLTSIPLAQGYPLALTIAHYHARVLPEEADALARGVGLELEEPARSMLMR